MVQAVPGRDFPVIQAAVVVFAVVFVVVNLIVDVVHGLGRSARPDRLSGLA